MIHNPFPGRTKTLSQKSIMRRASIRKETEAQHLMEHRLFISLQEISMVLTVEVDIQKILGDMATILAKALGAKWVNFWKLTPDGKALHITAHYGMQPEYIEQSRLHPIPVGKSLIGGAVQTKQAHGSSDLSKDAILGTVDKSWVEILAKQGVRAVLCTPTISGDKAIGGMCIYYSKSHQFTDFEMRLVTIVTNQAATALENARIHQELQARIEELEKFQKITVGRELKMAELKEEILVLRKELEK